VTAAKRRTQRPAESGLDLYRTKRDFTKTNEPAGGGRPAQATTLQFVIQKHAARNLHFDLRLQLDGVMKSWAVPKGPSLDPAVKRLAMPVEDHPIEYNTFEGTIPQGEYGGGTVMLWDRGTYEPDDAGVSARSADSAEDTLRDGYARGDLKFILHGKRLRGSWVLVRTRGGRGASSDRPQWLLIKHRDEEAKPGFDIVADVHTSVATGRTMDEIAAAADGHATTASPARANDTGDGRAARRRPSRPKATPKKAARKAATRRKTSSSTARSTARSTRRRP